MGGVLVLTSEPGAAKPSTDQSKPTVPKLLAAVAQEQMHRVGAIDRPAVIL
jgi:hypothetical protein